MRMITTPTSCEVPAPHNAQPSLEPVWDAPSHFDPHEPFRTWRALQTHLRDIGWGTDEEIAAYVERLERENPAALAMTARQHWDARR